MTTENNDAPRVTSNGRPNVAVKVLLRDLKRFVDQMSNDQAQVETNSWITEVENTLKPADLERKPSAKLLDDLVRLCVRGRMQPLLAAYEIPHPAYNYFEGFQENAPGPWDSLPQGWLVSTPAVWSLLGFDVGFPIGVPASVLTATADWIEYYARHGFNILTFKTVRSEFWKAHDEPNWVFLDGLEAPLSPDQKLPEAVQGDISVWPPSPTSFSMANSFGVPSFAPEVWQGDIAESLKRLKSHQLLIVSVMGMYEKYTGDDLVEDFAGVAKKAEDAGASAIELNLSCPNTFDDSNQQVKRPICESPEVTQRIVSEVRNKLDDKTRLVIKLSFLPHKELESLVKPVAKEINGISGINTLQMKVRRPDGAPTFGKREEGGVSGVAIREFGLTFVRSLDQIRREFEFNFDIIGMGGVMNTQDVFAYQRAGAAAVQTATMAFRNANLPLEVYRQLGGSAKPEEQLQARSVVLDLLSRGPMTLVQLAEHIEVLFPAKWTTLEKARTILRQLEAEGIVTADRSDGKLVFQAIPAGDLEITG